MIQARGDEASSGGPVMAGGEWVGASESCKEESWQVPEGEAEEGRRQAHPQLRCPGNAARGAGVGEEVWSVWGTGLRCHGPAQGGPAGPGCADRSGQELRGAVCLVGGSQRCEFR